MDGYLLVTEETLDRAAEVTGLPRTYWERDLERFDSFHRHLLIFPNEKGQIVSTSFDKDYNVPFVMKQKFDLEPIDG